MTRYFEDLEVGQTFEFGSRTVSKDEIVQFAEKYDPQPFHVDEEAAENSMFDGLVASGLHTLCLSGRMTVDEFLSDVANLGGRGMENIQFSAPVRPGDTLSVRLQIDAKSANTERHGDVRFLQTVLNHEHDEVLAVTSVNIVERRQDGT